MKHEKLILNEVARDVTLTDKSSTVVKSYNVSTKPNALLTGTRSDAHSWNLIYVAEVLKEQGFDVVNLGPNAPVNSLLFQIGQFVPDIIVVSSINGHGAIEGHEIAQALTSSEYSDIPLVIGGLLTTSPAELTDAKTSMLSSGFDAVFTGAEAMAEFKHFVSAIVANSNVKGE